MIFWADTNTLICDFNPNFNLLWLLLRNEVLGPNLDGLISLAKLDCILNQIDENLLNAGLIDQGNLVL